MKQNRRQFLFLASAGAGGLWLSSCASFDRLFFEDQDDDRDRIVILGAGLAGLAASYQLSKSGQPIRIYEASARVGGRVFTINANESLGQSVDLGGEWIDHSHKSLLALCREVKVPTLEIKEMGRTPGYYFKSEWEKEKVILRQQVQFKKLAENALKVKSPISVGEWIKSLDKTTEFGQSGGFWVRRQCQFFLGVDPDQASLQELVARWKPMQDLQIKIDGGAGQLARALADRVIGVLPDRILRLRHELVEIDREDEELYLTFSTKRGKRTVRARRVICSLPWTILRGVKGLEKLDLSAQQLSAIRKLDLGTQSKVSVVATGDLPQYRWIGDGETQCWWSQYPRQKSWQASGSRFVLASQMGGVSGQLVGLHTLKQLSNDLLQMLPKNKFELNDTHWIQNWSQMPFSKGSVSFVRPGQENLVKDFISSSQVGSNWLFAGEQLGDTPGTMNGAIQSGLKAAQRLIES